MPDDGPLGLGQVTAQAKVLDITRQPWEEQEDARNTLVVVVLLLVVFVVVAAAAAAAMSTIMRVDD